MQRRSCMMIGSSECTEMNLLSREVITANSRDIYR